MLYGRVGICPDLNDTHQSFSSASLDSACMPHTAANRLLPLQDPDSLHASCPVRKGDKWSATKWIRQRFHEPEEDDYDNDDNNADSGSSAPGSATSHAPDSPARRADQGKH